MATITVQPRTTTSSTTTLRLAALAVGAAVGSAGHLLHPLDHEAAARLSSGFELAHVLMAFGAVLVAAGVPLLRERLGPDPVAAVVCGAFWLGNVLIVPSVLVEGVVGPRVDDALNDEIIDATAWLGGLTMSYLLGFLAIGVLGWRRRVVARPVAALLVAGAVLLFALPGLPGTEGHWIIPTMVALNVATAAAGAGALRPRASRLPS